MLSPHEKRALDDHITGHGGEDQYPREEETHEREPRRIPDMAGVARPSPYCRRCSRRLSAAASIRHGYGSKCWAKVAHRSRVDEETGALEPCTITDEAEAARTRREIRKRLLRPVKEGEYRRVACHCGRHLSEADLLSMDHDAGEVLKGYGKPQWFYFLCECGYQYAIWKLGDLGPIIRGLTTGEVLPGGTPTMEAFREGGEPATAEDLPLPPFLDHGEIVLSLRDFGREILEADL
jgi:hypothetical protein